MTVGELRYIPSTLADIQKLLGEQEDSNQEVKCSICLSQFTQEEIAKREVVHHVPIKIRNKDGSSSVPPIHPFHKGCITEWASNCLTKSRY